MGPILKKLSSQTYPGFAGIKSYIEDCGGMSLKDDAIGISRNMIFPHDRPGTGTDPGNVEELMNSPEFRFFHNLLPAGTDPVTAVCQFMVLGYRSKLGLDNESGTYLMKFHIWTSVYEHKNEAQMSQQVMFRYSCSNKEEFSTIVCL